MSMPILYLAPKESFSQKTDAYSVSQIKYAKAKDNCFLFKTSDISDSSYRNVIFIIPSSYFVTVLSEVNTMITKVQYKNKIGYVSADSVTKVSFVPVSPTLEGVSFDISEDVGTQIRSSPVADNTSNVLKIIPAGTVDISYTATILGDIPTGGSSNVWYYATYTPISDPTSVYEGYVYSEKTYNLTEIPKNLEDDLKPSEEISEEDEEIGFTINDTIKVVLIVLICVPIVLVFVLLVAHNKRNKKDKEVEQEYKNFVKKEEEKTQKYDNFQFDEEAHKRSRVRKQSIRKIRDLEGKAFEKKEPYYARFISQEPNGDNSSTPAFPTYEVIDDDDLL